MNILLVLPNESEQSGHYMANLGTSMPLGLGYLAAVLRREGHGVHVLDFQIRGTGVAAMTHALSHRRFDACGISVTTPFSQAAYRVTAEVKKASPGTAVILGGPHTVAVGGKVFEDCPDADWAVFGEGEVTLPELLGVIAGRRDPGTVRGIGFRSGGVVTTPPRDFIKDLDSIPFPAYQLFDLKNYHPMVAWYKRLPWANMISSRGCPHGCIYCNKNVWGRTCRLRSAQNVFEEIMLLKNSYGIREISFSDDTFTVNRERTVELCELLISADTPVIWKCSTRVDHVDAGLLRLLQRAGCYSVGYGVESGSQRILDYIRKGVTKEQIRAAFRDSRAAGLETRAYFMLNLPHDDTSTTEETIRFSRELDPDYIDFEIAHPYPGTEFHRLIEQDSRYTIVREHWDNPRAQIGNYIVYLQPGLPEDALRRFMRRAFVGYYLRPKQLFRQLRSLLTPGRARATLRAAWNVLRVMVAA
ncbi:MAG: radical SAM protein [Candidatus Aureabacteria bacterium]|nr:radical SAM protein [Candidatus Auribacterota bacterium]